MRQSVAPGVSPGFLFLAIFESRRRPDQSAKEIAVDLRRMIAPSSRTTVRDVPEQRPRRSLLPWTATGLAVVALAAVALLFQGRLKPHTPSSQTWVQLTDFPDSATSPALSSDGRMLAFIRGSNTFVGPGDVYLKLLPSGEPLRLTTDGKGKEDPLFSPDGSRVVYTTGPLPYDVWSVPVTGGTPRLMMRNAGTLTWTPDGHVLFAEIRGAAQMAVVTATESRSQQRDIYVPPRVSGMAHRAYLSPDAKWVLIAEMDTAGTGWLPCRVVPFDGSSRGQLVGPKSAPCTSGAWSPDGKWVYLSSATGGSYHIWRQRFPDGEPEQITSGPTQEEGIAIAPDGRSLITSVGGAQSTLRVRDRNGDRQIDTEAAVDDPRFSPTGGKLFFIVRKELRGPDQQIGELWMLDLATQNRERLLPDFRIHEYDISANGSDIVVTATDESGELGLWVAPLDRHETPRRITWGSSITEARFDPAGGLFVKAAEGDRELLYHVDMDGSNRRTLANFQANELIQISPSGKWVLLRAPLPSEPTRIGILALPAQGGRPVVISNQTWLAARWSADRKFFEILSQTDEDPVPVAASILLPLVDDLPQVPAGGLSSPREAANLPGAKVVRHGIPAEDMAAFASSPDGSTSAYIRTVVHRNLYRVPIPD